MKNNKINLVVAVLYFVGSISFILSAVFHTVMLSKGLFSVAGLCLLMSSVAYLFIYVKNNRNEKDNSKKAESLE